MYFKYNNKHIDYIKSKDEKLKKIINHAGYIQRKCNSDVFDELVRSIIGQLISTKAADTVYKRLKEKTHINQKIY